MTIRRAGFAHLVKQPRLSPARCRRRRYRGDYHIQTDYKAQKPKLPLSPHTTRQEIAETATRLSFSSAATLGRCRGRSLVRGPRSPGAGGIGGGMTLADGGQAPQPHGSGRQETVLSVALAAAKIERGSGGLHRRRHSDDLKATLGWPEKQTGVRAMSVVWEHLEGQGVPFEPIEHKKAYTSIAEARACDIDASEVVKTVAVRVGSEHALMVVPATCRLDLRRVQAAVGDRHARLATEAELLRDFPDVELGAMPPLALLLGAPLYVDPEVLRHDTVVFAAGSQTQSVRLRTKDLLQFQQERVTTAPLAKQAEEDHKDWLG
jgi:Ala-tRNA(Pro) deacylase